MSDESNVVLVKGELVFGTPKIDDPNFPRVTPHDLRHTAASLAARAVALALAA